MEAVRNKFYKYLFDYCIMEPNETYGYVSFEDTQLYRVARLRRAIFEYERYYAQEVEYVEIKEEETIQEENNNNN